MMEERMMQIWQKIIMEYRMRLIQAILTWKLQFRTMTE